MKGNIGQLMKQAQVMQDNMRRMQEQLASIEVEGQAGGGSVKVLMTCKHEVRRVTIDPGLAGEEREMLEDLLTAAFNDAAVKEAMAKQGNTISISTTEQAQAAFRSELVKYANLVKKVGLQPQ